ncbi:MAG: hypothetical protein M1826_000715 [Phylliscum demangeonii]|nr:MAG: hypothetical protein M1826_000715 [Phylliscum demangeonii]
MVTTNGLLSAATFKPSTNGANWSQTNGHHASTSQEAALPAKVLVNIYQDSFGGRLGEETAADKERSRFHSSLLLNGDDPVTVHLLVESALEDSQEYEILSLEETEELKRESTLLKSRVQATERKLLLETKVRDAALSLGRLSAKTSSAAERDTPYSRRPGTSSSKESGKRSFDPVDDEWAASNSKCEKLAQLLWGTNKRLSFVHKRLLEHTAGVLQMTYQHASTEEIEDSARTLQDPYLSAANGATSYPLPNGVSSTQHKDILDPLPNLQQQTDMRSQRPDRGFDESMQTIHQTAKGLEELNAKLRSLIMSVNASNADQPPLRSAEASSTSSTEHIQAQLQYLSTGLGTVESHYNDQKRRLQGQENSVQDEVKRLEGELDQLVIECSIQEHRPAFAPSEASRGARLGADGQLSQLVARVELIKQELKSKTQHSPHQGKAEQYETVVTGLWEILVSGEADRRSRQPSLAGSISKGGLGDDLFAKGKDSPLEMFSLQAFSGKVQRLFDRVNGLEVEKTILRRQIHQQRELINESDGSKGIVVAQLTEDLERAKLEIDKANREAEKARQELGAVMQRLDAARKESTLLEQQRATEDSNAMNNMARKQDEIDRLEALLQAAPGNQDRSGAEIQKVMTEHGLKVQGMEADLYVAEQEKARLAASEAVLRQQISDLTHQVVASDADAKNLESEVIRLQTEATVARAELDGAIGRRAPRAPTETASPPAERPGELEELAARNASLLAEVAALKRGNPWQHEHDAHARGQHEAALQQSIDSLRQELSDTIDEYQAMMRQSVESEKEREQLETTIDRLRERCESVENQLHDEKIRWLGVTTGSGASHGHGSGSGPAATAAAAGGGVKVSAGTGAVESTSATVLRSEFRKMMRDMRSESQKALKAEQEDRRKLEAKLRTLRKEHALSAKRSAVAASASAPAPAPLPSPSSSSR